MTLCTEVLHVYLVERVSPNPPNKCTLCTLYESPKLKANNFGLDSPSYYNTNHKDIIVEC